MEATEVTTYGPANDKGVPAAEMQLAESIARTGARNQAYLRMGPARKRVTLARDILARLDQGDQALRVRTGVYYRPTLDYQEVQTPAAGGECRVCALGSLLLTHLTRQTRAGRPDNSYGHYDRVSIVRELRGVFDEDQLALIECAFELSPVFWPGDGNEGMRAACWSSLSSGPRERLWSIMDNIVRNKGTFNLSDPPRKPPRRL